MRKKVLVEAMDCVDVRFEIDIDKIENEIIINEN